jgi:hypothetical protein
MRLVELLESLGDKLGILEKAERNAAHTAWKIQTRTVTLAELTSEIRAKEVQALADLPAELSVPFEKIMEAAGITPGPGGWTIERLRELLLTDDVKKLSREEAQKRILGVLASEKVSAEDLVKDAISRDRAMDAFEKTARRKMEDRLAARERQIAEADAKIKEIERERARPLEQLSSDRERWREWRSRKRGQERDLAWCVGYLIDHQVITTDDNDD